MVMLVYQRVYPITKYMKKIVTFHRYLIYRTWWWLSTSRLLDVFQVAFQEIARYPSTNSSQDPGDLLPMAKLRDQEIRRYLPSGKLLHNYGKSPFYNGKIHYIYGHFQ